MTQPDLPRHARIVIVGGGVIGCSIAYHLAKSGETDVLLLEQGQIGSGTSWHAAGLVGQLRASATLTAMSRYGVELYAGLEAETGLATGWRQCGSLSIARTPERLAVLRRTARRAASLGVEMHLVSPAEAAERFPLMRHDDLLGAAWLPGDGKANPTDLMQSLLRGARSRGVRVMEGVEVTGVSTQPLASRPGQRCVSGVVTTKGEITCELMVNCAGMWARQFGQLAGVNVPLFAAEHFYLVTDRIAGVTPGLPVLRDPDGAIYYKEEVGGLVMGGFERQAKPWAMDPVPATFQFQLLDEDWDQFEPLMQAALHRTPCLETAPIKMLLNGPESFTPDGNFILGEAPELANYFVCAGFNSAGIANAGGAGRWMAEWMLRGAAPCDLGEVDIRRFSPWTANRRWLAERCAETLGLHYAMRWPREELASGRPLRCSPLYDSQASRGAVFGSRNGWERALYFKPADAAVPTPGFGTPGWLPWVQAEQAAAREAVALYDASSLGKLLLQGPQAQALLQRACLAEVGDADLPVGRVAVSLLRDTRGAVAGEVCVIRLGDERFMLCTGSTQPTRDADTLRRHARAGDVFCLDEVSGQTAVLALIGPNAAALLAELGAAAALTLRPHHSVEVDLALARVRLVGLNYAGGPGCEIHLPVELARHVEQALRRAGERHGLRDIGSHALDGLRIEAGVAVLGIDIAMDDESPGDLVGGPGALDSIGAQRLAPHLSAGAASMPGPQRLHTPAGRPVRLVFDDPLAWAWGGEVVLLGDEVIGTVSSSGWSSRAGRSVAWLRLSGDTCATPLPPLSGTQVRVELCSESGIALAPARLA
ncbi:MAG: FAD-dependent oxidoreductase [Burkholderiales bacterium]|nr:FAD-dependent oxidoreductase [Burkholderiales bacterium]